MPFKQNTLVFPESFMLTYMLMRHRFTAWQHSCISCGRIGFVLKEKKLPQLKRNQPVNQKCFVAPISLKIKAIIYVYGF